jgi:hypothetical protein
MQRMVFLVLLVVASPAFGATCVAQSAAERPHLIELYTSEGCSSCPPAEHWFSSLRDNASFIGLEFHVDYWDSLGWRDPFSDARYTERQRELAQRGARGIVYTPQVVLDGHVWKDWPKGKPQSVDAPAPAMTLELERGDAMQVKVTTSSAAPSGHWRAYVALSENGLASSVKAGENRGKELAHDLVVRDIAGPLSLPQGSATLKPPAGFDTAKSSVVAFVEDTSSGDIVQTVRLPLARCTP